jgi:hypothetical protein
MKRNIAIILSASSVLFLLVFPGCHREENDLISQNCKNNCTVVSGQFLTNGGVSPLANVPITLFWGYTVMEGGSVEREKAVTRTDVNGNFRLSFSMRDDELENGGFYFKFNVDEQKYYTQNSSRLYLPVLKQDTLVYDTYIIPAKAFLDLSITNPDSLTATQGITSNFDSRYGNALTGIAIIFWNDFPFPSNKLVVPANQPIFVQTNKYKHGVQSTTYDTLSLMAGETRQYSVTF